MKIVMFSINPIFPEFITGGASKHLYHIARNLGAKGHDIEIHSACQNDKQSILGKNRPFTWSENVKVVPDLPFSLPFPQPYAVSGAELALIVSRLTEALKTADRFYNHDGEFLIPDVYESVPTTVSFRDNVYPESVLGSFISKADEVICVSGFSAAVIEHTSGRFFPNLKHRMHQVNNGIDFNVFSPKDSNHLAEELGVDPKCDVILLHPHRPEHGKGLPETIQVVDRLVNQHQVKNLKVLVPEWIGSMLSPSDSAFYNAMMQLMQDVGIRDHFVFIPWMPIEKMPALYSLGKVTLCLGNLVEAFGNVAYESLACGTPSIVARVGVHRTMMPDELINKVHYGDIASAVTQVNDILNGNRPPYDRVISYLKVNMDFERQVETYAEIITRCEKRERLVFSPPDEAMDQVYQLAPWCYIDGNRIYHDFHGVFKQDGQLTDLFNTSREFCFNDAKAVGVSETAWKSWMDQTWIVPIQERVREL